MQKMLQSQTLKQLNAETKACVFLEKSLDGPLCVLFFCVFWIFKDFSNEAAALDNVH